MPEFIFFVLSKQKYKLSFNDLQNNYLKKK